MPAGGKRAGAGRPKHSAQRFPSAFADYIHEQTRHGEELVDFAVKVLRAKPETSVLELGKVQMSDRLDALKYLTDRGWGKAKDTLQLEGSESLADLLKLALGRAATK